MLSLKIQIPTTWGLNKKIGNDEKSEVLYPFRRSILSLIIRSKNIFQTKSLNNFFQAEWFVQNLLPNYIAVFIETSLSKTHNKINVNIISISKVK